jgi:hypothetical protein
VSERGDESPPSQRWAAFADAVLWRGALRRRALGQPAQTPGNPRVVRDADVDRLVSELPTMSQLVEPTTDEVEALVASCREDIHDDYASDPLAWVVAAADLDRVSVEVLAVATGVSWSPVRQRLVGYIQDDVTLGGLVPSTFPLLLDLPTDVVNALAPDSALRRFHLVDVDDIAGNGTAAVSVPSIVQWYLVGDDSRDPDLPASALIFPGEPACAPGRWLVHGPDRVRRLQSAAKLVGTSRMLVTPEPENDHQWAAVVRTAVCRSLAVVVETTALSPIATGFFHRADTLAWVVSSVHPMALQDVPPMPFVEVAAGNEPASDDEVAAVLGGVPTGHRLRAEQVQLLGRVPGTSAEEAVRRLASNALERLARRVHPRRGWDDLVLPADKLQRVREVVARARYHDVVYEQWGFSAVPSNGVVALFVGPPGTGKTMTAEIIAGELGLDMFTVDLSSVVSKYIGETEKHLGQLFDAAEGGGVLLVFDEADALFAKRTQVEDSHDRYANIEAGYLLQRLEAYSGLVILTSNLASNIDEAFLRRIHISVDFSMPDEAERRRIWEVSIPKTAPLAADVDLDFVAKKMRLAGGSIRTAALTAAFAAAADDSAITMAHVTHGLRREYHKLGRIITSEDFGPWYEQLTGSLERPAAETGGKRGARSDRRHGAPPPAAK